MAALTFVMVAATLPPVKPEWWIAQEEDMNRQKLILEIEKALIQHGASVDTYKAAAAVVDGWSQIRRTMDGATPVTEPEHGEFTGSTPAGSTVEAERALKLEAPVCPVCGHPEDFHDVNCTPQKRLEARRQRVAQREADFEAENDANEFKRPDKLAREGDES